MSAKINNEGLEQIKKMIAHRAKFLAELSKDEMIDLIIKDEFWDGVLRANYCFMKAELEKYKKDLDEALASAYPRPSLREDRTYTMKDNDSTKCVIEIQKDTEGEDHVSMISCINREDKKDSAATFTEVKEKPPFKVFLDYTNESLCVYLDYLVNHIKDGKCLFIGLETYKSIKLLLTEGKYNFHQSRETNTNELKVFLWKA